MNIDNILNQIDKGHAERVSQMTYELCRACGLSDGESSTISHAALYHDIGKVAIPKNILDAPGPLTPKEMEKMKQHVVFGLRLLVHREGKVMDMVKTVIATHHERWDGSGYPKGLRGEQIPLPGRIVAICDVFDALRSERTYKPAWPIERVVAYVENGSGTEFDPHLVDKFMKMSVTV